MSILDDPPGSDDRSKAGVLPHEVLTAPGRRFIVALIVGAVAMVWGANWGALRLLEAYPQNLGYENIRAAWDRLDDLDEPTDWLVLGDSGCDHAIVTDVLAESLGGSVTKACTLGNMGLIDDAWMLARTIDDVGPPRGVLIVHVYDVWQRGLPPSALLAQVPLPIGYWRRLRPGLHLDARQSTDVFLARHVPLVGERRSLRNLVFRGAAEVLPLRPGRRQQTQDAGNRASILGDLKEHQTYSARRHFLVSQTNLNALDQIVELADEHGLDIYIANGPLWEGLVRDSAFHRYNREVQDYLTTYAGKHPSVHHVSETLSYDMRSMLTVDHLRDQPAIAYTRDLAKRVIGFRDYGNIPR